MRAICQSEQASWISLPERTKCIFWSPEFRVNDQLASYEHVEKLRHNNKLLENKINYCWQLEFKCTLSDSVFSNVWFMCFNKSWFLSCKELINVIHSWPHILNSIFVQTRNLKHFNYGFIWVMNKINII